MTGKSKNEYSADLTPPDQMVPDEDPSSDGHPELAHPAWEMTSWLRRATIILAADHCGLKAYLDRHADILLSNADNTSALLLKAGAVLGLFNCNQAGSYSWARDYCWARTDHARWKQFLAVIRHQLSYIHLVDSAAFWSDNELSPSLQLAKDPAAYEAFLRGVEESHRRHALWLSQIDDLRHCNHMADLGGGLGTYAVSWVNSSPTRRAIIVDFPQVHDFLTFTLQQHNDRLTFLGANLTDTISLPQTVDFVLFANVLHLISCWPTILKRFADTLGNGVIIGIFEANPNTPQGVLFDLQVHLRSGRVAGLLNPADIVTHLQHVGLKNIRQLTIMDMEDPFRREYALWLGQVAHSTQTEKP